LLRVTESNRLETLADRLVDELRVPAGGVFTPDVVVVQNAGMQRWLALRIARARGVCANVRFPLPARFIWDLLDRGLGPTAGGARLDAALLTWRLMEILAHLPATREMAPLLDYLAGGDDRRRYELACRIADVFDQYLVYRPDWIRHWEGGGDEGWQAALWRLVVRDAPARHRVDLLEAFGAACVAGRIPPDALPPRVAVFGIPSLPPPSLEVFGRLADAADVHLLLVNPCRREWSTIVSEPELARRSARGEDLHFEIGNPLLASLGKQGREFLDLARERVGHQVDEAFVEPSTDTVLGRVQADVLDLRHPGRDDTPVVATAADDGSIEIHACHGPLREVEVLHDRLLALFDAHPDLRPSDVVVMTPDIEAYAPAVEAVFDTVPAARRIPFTIADRSLGAESPLVRAFLALLELPASRYEATRLMALLDVEAVRRRFGLTETDLALVREWVRASGIRWGVDAEARATAGLPALPEHTWRFGLDRILAGYARRGDDHPLVAGILPLDDVEGTQARAAGLVATFAEAAFALRDTLAASRPAAAWARDLATLVERFFAPSEAEQAAAQALRGALASLDDVARDAGADEPVSLAVVDAHLRRALATPVATGRFLAGRVTFCAMVPMRSVPFEVVCLLGLSDGAFPRAQRPPAFDLMAADFRRGDRSRRDDDRWLFLEAILSARRQLYASYVGRDIRDNEPRPPSPLLAELIDVLARCYGFTDRVVQHPLQPFSAKYFTGEGPLFSYADEFAAASRVAAGARRRSVPLVETRLPDADESWRTITVDQLVQFFRNPARFLLKERMGIHLGERAGLVESREPLLLNGLEAYQLREELLGLLHRGHRLDHAIAVARAAGLVPHGSVGDVLAAREGAEAVTLAERLAALRPSPPLDPIPIDLQLGEVRLTGTLDDVMREGRVESRPGRVKAGDRTGLWIRHLVLACAAPATVARRSWFLGIADGELVLGDVARPQACLADLAALFWEGLHVPLRYFPRAALAGFEARTDPLGAARREWVGSDFEQAPPGEAKDDYVALAFRGVDPIDERLLAMAKRVFGPMREAAERWA
jgi:exodeoxyribonuclease V gamma subunit